jgi:hypothetical protein
VRATVLPALIIAGLLLVVLVLPSKRDTSVSAWWNRVRYQAKLWARIAIALMVVVGTVWFIVLPMLDLMSIYRRDQQ